MLSVDHWLLLSVSLFLDWLSVFFQPDKDLDSSPLRAIPEKTYRLNAVFSPSINPFAVCFLSFSHSLPLSFFLSFQQYQFVVEQRIFYFPSQNSLSLVVKDVINHLVNQHIQSQWSLETKECFAVLSGLRVSGLFRLWRFVWCVIKCVQTCTCNQPHPKVMSQSPGVHVYITAARWEVK